MNVLELVVLIILSACIIKGIKDGLILTICSFLILFVAITVTQAVTPQVSAVLKQDKGMVSFWTGHVKNVLFEPHSDKESKEQEKPEKIIQGLSIPKVIKEQLIENNIQKTYKTLGINSVEEYVSMYIAYSIINCIAYIVVFVIVIIILQIIVRAINLVSKLPVINTMNKLGGAIIGLIRGLIIVWIGLIAVTMLGSTRTGVQMYEQINNSKPLSYLYSNNVILNTILYITKGFF